jgi:hypothetical protein
VVKSSLAIHIPIHDLFCGTTSASTAIFRFRAILTRATCEWTGNASRSAEVSRTILPPRFRKVPALAIPASRDPWPNALAFSGRSLPLIFERAPHRTTPANHCPLTTQSLQQHPLLLNKRLESQRPCLITAAAMTATVVETSRTSSTCMLLFSPLVERIVGALHGRAAHLKCGG